MTEGEVQNDMVDVRNDEGEIQAMRLPPSAREKSDRHPEQSEGSENRFFTAFRMTRGGVRNDRKTGRQRGTGLNNKNIQSAN